ncbi:MAG: hypothetical protein AAFQ71_11580 [Planctomycetota bacterium]
MSGSNARGAVRLDADELYWGVIETTAVDPIPFGGLRPESVRRQRTMLLEAVLPVPMEDVHAVFVPIGGGRFAACAIARARIVELRSEGASSVRPHSVPAALSGNAGLAPERFELLSGPFRSIAAVRSAHRTALIAAALLITSCVLLIVGLERRTASYRAAADDWIAGTGSIYDRVLPASASTAPPDLRLVTELRTLRRQTGRAETAGVSAGSVDATLALSGLLSVWPEGVEARVTQLVAAERTIRITAEARDDAAAQAVIDAAQTLDGWALLSDRLDRSPRANEPMPLRLLLVLAADGAEGSR